jgi:hypothetical protein
LKKIIFVPGKNPKPPAAAHREQLLRCLLHGVRRIDPQSADEIGEQDSFSVVAWNHLMYDRQRDINEIIPWVDQLLAQPGHNEEDVRDARPPRYRLAKAMYVLGDHIHWLIPLIPDPRIKASIRDTEVYFSNHNNLGCRIRDLQKQPLRDAAADNDRVLLIGHSMGSVIAYDALWELDHLEGYNRCVDCLLTIGSPLGMNYVQKRLIGHRQADRHIYPGNIGRWVNIASRGDLVALDPSLTNDFADMISQNHISSITDRSRDVYNYYRDGKGINVHKSYGYLVNPHVARVITDWWKAP